MALSLNCPKAGTVMAAMLLLSAAVSAFAQDNSSMAAAPQAGLPAAVTAAPSLNWRNDIGTFKIGMVRGWSSDMSRPALARVETVFAKALGTPVKVVVFERFTSLMDAQADGRIDLAAYSARGFATVRLMCECVDAIASPTTMAGATGQIAVLAGDPSQIRSLSAIGPAKLGRVTNAKIAAQDMLSGTLTINGKAVTGKEDYWVDYPDYFAALKAYQDNEIDGFVLPAATSFSGLAEAGDAELNLLAETLNDAIPRPATALWRSSYWPFGPIAVRANIPADARQIVLRTLEQMDVTEPLVHATLSEGLPGPMRKADMTGLSNVSASIRWLVSQNANGR